MEEYQLCHRCGFVWPINKNKRRKERPLCKSCRVQKAATVQNKGYRCLPWHGRFGPDMVTPVHDDGEPVLPGERVCGNADCVNPNHVKE